jgi:outer membrane assembly lipoprotein YfiO
MKARTFILMVTAMGVHSLFTQDQTIAQNPEIPKVTTKKRNQKYKEKRAKRINSRPVYKVYTDMNFEELAIAKDKKLAQKDYDATLKYLEQLLKISTDVNQTALLMVEYADLLLEQGELKKAGKVYTEFTHLYPGHTKHEYALYKATVCSFYSTLSSDRDQTATENAISLAQNFLENPTYKIYEKEVADIQKQCFKKVVQSELDICNFYLKQGSFKAAEQRIAQLKTTYVPKIPDIEPDILAMELEIAEKQETTRTAHQKTVAPKSHHASIRF